MLVVVEQVNEHRVAFDPAYLLRGRIGLLGVELGPAAVNVSRRRVAREQDAARRVLPEPVDRLRRAGRALRLGGRRQHEQHEREQLHGDPLLPVPASPP